ncbi:hypothetical protein JB92DRAFT_1543121 [Gautieria morchelliformis]|nr:hypothetical protein JB92DRAFT_1543121 [Gautieria morchelliformis]
MLHVRDGPKESLTQISPAPRRRLKTTRTPSVPTQPQLKATSRVPRPKPPPLGQRTPFDELRNADGSDTHVAPRSVSSRSVSVASSVYPHIERQELGVDADPYTPLPTRRTVEGKSGRHSVIGENNPPNAPARPTRGQARKHTSRDRQCARPARHKASVLPSKHTSNEQSTSNPPYIDATLPTTPVRNPTLMKLQTPSRPSPASSSELSPEGRQIMAIIRAKAHKSSQTKPRRTTPRAWQPWGDTVDL